MHRVRTGRARRVCRARTHTRANSRFVQGARFVATRVRECTCMRAPRVSYRLRRRLHVGAQYRARSHTHLVHRPRKLPFSRPLLPFSPPQLSIQLYTLILLGVLGKDKIIFPFSRQLSIYLYTLILLGVLVQERTLRVILNFSTSSSNKLEVENKIIFVDGKLI